MKKDALRGAEKYTKEHQRKKRWYRVVTCLACVVVFCTVYALILPAITLEKGACEIPEHTHSEACYTQVTSTRTEPVCTIESLNLHQHDDTCYDSEGNLTCGYADYVVHRHDSSCYDEDGNLWCPLPEIETHEHTDSCYAVPETGEPELICDKTEVILHEHTSDCFDDAGNLICGKIQVLEHQHTDACFETVEEPVDADTLTCTLPEDENHTHGPLCYGNWELTCGMEEHTHSEECQGTEEALEQGNLNMILPEGAQIPDGYDAHYSYIDPDNRFGVTVYASEGALPDNAVLSAELLEQGSEAYEAAQQALTDTVYDGFAALDIHFTVDGEEIEPESSVYVCINVMGLLPEDADADTLAVQYHEQSGAALLTPDEEESPAPAGAATVETVADAAQETGQVEALDNGTETAADVAAAFEVESFSTFTITWTDNSNYVLNLHYVDTAGKDIAPSEAQKNFETVNNTANVTMRNYADEIDHPGYVYQYAYIINGGEKPKVIKLSYNTNKWYFTTETATDDWTRWAGSDGRTSMDVYLVYQEINTDGTVKVTWQDGEYALYLHYVDTEGNPLQIDTSKTYVDSVAGDGNITVSEYAGLVYPPTSYQYQNAYIEVNNAQRKVVQISYNAALGRWCITTPESDGRSNQWLSWSGDENVSYNETQAHVYLSYAKNCSAADPLTKYAIVGTETLTTQVITAKGETFTIEVTYGPEAGIPADAELRAEEIASGSDEYIKYSEDALVAMTEEDAVVSFARFFDVSIYSGDTKIEPTAPVDIKITYDSPLSIPNDGEIKQVHFTTEGTEVLDVEMNKNDEGEIVGVEFSQNSFSVTGTVVTSLADDWPDSGYFVTIVKPINGNRYYAVSNTGTLTEVELTTEGEGDDAVTKVKFKDLTSLDQLNTYNKWEHEEDDGNHRLVSVTGNTSNTRNFIDPADSDGISLSERNLTRNSNGTLSRRSEGRTYYLTVDETNLRLEKTSSNSNNQRAVVFFSNDYVLDGSDEPGTPGQDDDDPDLGAPATTKSLTPNNDGDGTYKLALTVTGTSQGSHDRTEADVLVVFDTSGSMTSTRISSAKSALRELASTLLANNTTQYPNTVRMAMVTFSTDVNRTVSNYNWTNSVSTFAGTKNGNNWSGGYVEEISNSGSGGTNWEVALQEANKPSNWIRPNAEKYVIFISDGDPTFHKTDGNYNNWNNSYDQYGSGYDGFGNETNVRRCYDQAKDDAKTIVDSGKNFYTLGVFGSLGRMSNLTAYAYSGNDTGTYPAGHFQTAADEASLKAAFQSIIDDIEKNFKFTDVTLNDGITDMTAQTGIVSGDVQNFEYKITYTDAADNTVKTVPITKNADGSISIPSVTYSYRDKDNNVIRVTTEAVTVTGANYSKDSNDHGSVSWNLKKTTGDNKNYKLEAGWTYEVAFDVWPSQNAYDILAALNNGDLTYEDPDATWNRKAIDWTQFEGSAGNYSLLTNTTASVSYRQISTVNGQEQTPTEVKTSPITQKPSMTLTSSQMTIRKIWNDSAFVNNRPDSIQLEVLSDGKHHTNVTLTGSKTDNVWEATVDIAPGLKVDGQIKETGHDYTVVERDDYRYNFETETIHPMLIDSATNITYGGDGDAYLTATNTLRGGINISKKVVSPDGSDISSSTAEKDKEFTFSLSKLELPDGMTLEDLDDSYTKDGKFVVWVQLIGADGSNVGSSYQMGQGDTFTLKPGQTLRLTNMPVGTKYEFSETEQEGYTLDSITEEKRTTPDAATPATVSAASGTVEGNTNYYYVFSNKRNAFDVNIEKVDAANSDTKLKGAEFVLYNEDGTTLAKDADGNYIGVERTVDRKTLYVVTSDNNGAIALGSLVDGTYVLQEIKAPDGYNLMESNVTITVRADAVTAMQGTSQCTVTPSADGTTYTIRVTNSSGYELPHTGGSGTLPYTLGGIALIMASALMYGFRMRRRERRLN